MINKPKKLYQHNEVTFPLKMKNLKKSLNSMMMNLRKVIGMRSDIRSIRNKSTKNTKSIENLKNNKEMVKLSHRTNLRRKRAMIRMTTINSS